MGVNYSFYYGIGTIDNQISSKSWIYVYDNVLKRCIRFYFGNSRGLLIGYDNMETPTKSCISENTDLF